MSNYIVNVDTGSYVNLRENPSTKANIKKKVLKGTYVDVLETVDDTWYKVSVNDITGYMMRKFVVQLNGSVSKDDLRKVYIALQNTLKTIEDVLK